MEEKAESLLADAMRLGVSDIHLLPYEDHYELFFPREYRIVESSRVFNRKRRTTDFLFQIPFEHECGRKAETAIRCCQVPAERQKNRTEAVHHCKFPLPRVARDPHAVCKSGLRTGFARIFPGPGVGAARTVGPQERAGAVFRAYRLRENDHHLSFAAQKICR